MFAIYETAQWCCYLLPDHYQDYHRELQVDMESSKRSLGKTQLGWLGAINHSVGAREVRGLGLQRNRWILLLWDPKARTSLVTFGLDYGALSAKECLIKGFSGSPMCLAEAHNNHLNDDLISNSTPSRSNQHSREHLHIPMHKHANSPP